MLKQRIANNQWVDATTAQWYEFRSLGKQKVRWTMDGVSYSGEVLDSIELDTHHVFVLVDETIHYLKTGKTSSNQIAILLNRASEIND